MAFTLTTDRGRESITGPHLEKTMQYYENHGVGFSYPEKWTVEEQAQPGGVAITVENPEARDISFWTLTLLFDRPDPVDVLEAAMQAFRDEYSDLDEYPVVRSACGRAAVGRDLEFLCLELLNSAALTIFETDGFTGLILYQGTDHELEQTRPLFEQITESLVDLSPE